MMILKCCSVPIVSESVSCVQLISCVPKLSVRTSECTDFKDHASEVHETLHLRRISYLCHQVFPIAASVA